MIRWVGWVQVMPIMVPMDLAIYQNLHVLFLERKC